jgi:hypothetical protein
MSDSILSNVSAYKQNRINANWKEYSCPAARKNEQIHSNIEDYMQNRIAANWKEYSCPAGK